MVYKQHMNSHPHTHPHRNHQSSTPERVREEEEPKAKAKAKAKAMSSSAPVKSQSKPLHNFSLPYLKWGNNQRCRKPPQPKNNNHGGCSASEAESDSGSSQQQQPGGGSSNNNNLIIKIPKLSNKTVDEGDGKPWNLRPRRGIMNNEVEERGDAVMMNQHQHHQQKEKEKESLYQPKSLRLRGLVEGDNVEKKEKKYKFSVPLSRDEIEEDFFAWTGSKPPRRPKKRNKTVQKHVDNAFPGLWLAGISIESYDVTEVPAKKKKK